MLCNVIDNGRLIRRLIIIRNIRGSNALQCDCQPKTYKSSANNHIAVTSEALMLLQCDCQ